MTKLVNSPAEQPMTSL